MLGCCRSQRTEGGWKGAIWTCLPSLRPRLAQLIRLPPCWQRGLRGRLGLRGRTQRGDGGSLLRDTPSLCARRSHALHLAHCSFFVPFSQLLGSPTPPAPAPTGHPTPAVPFRGFSVKAVHKHLFYSGGRQARRKPSVGRDRRLGAECFRRAPGVLSAGNRQCALGERRRLGAAWRWSPGGRGAPVRAAHGGGRGESAVCPLRRGVHLCCLRRSGHRDRRQGAERGRFPGGPGGQAPQARPGTVRSPGGRESDHSHQQQTS